MIYKIIFSRSTISLTNSPRSSSNSQIVKLFFKHEIKFESLPHMHEHFSSSYKIQFFSWENAFPEKLSRNVDGRSIAISLRDRILKFLWASLAAANGFLAYCHEFRINFAASNEIFVRCFFWGKIIHVTQHFRHVKNQISNSFLLFTELLLSSKIFHQTLIGPLLYSACLFPQLNIYKCRNNLSLLLVSCLNDPEELSHKSFTKASREGNKMNGKLNNEWWHERGEN